MTVTLLSELGKKKDGAACLNSIMTSQANANTFAHPFISELDLCTARPGVVASQLIAHAPKLLTHEKAKAPLQDHAQEGYGKRVLSGQCARTGRIQEDMAHRPRLGTG